ncbi:MAG TPA: hypothetical protein VKZ53_00780 [Candidatus Angelobacter sp.]|nr:hypothetical protein [Candidatus Angelobacter sp.]
MNESAVRTERVEIARVLESAVVLSWKDLLRKSKEGLVHVEYGTAPEPSLQYLKFWLSTTKGTWDLICEYWMSSGSSKLPAAGLTFSNGYHSADLAMILGQMMRHHDGFADSLSGKSGVNLIQVQSPTAGDRMIATTCMTEAYHRLGLPFVGGPGAA